MIPAEDVDAFSVVLQGREFGSEHLQRFQNLPVLQILQILLLQEQELHALDTQENSSQDAHTAMCRGSEVCDSYHHSAGGVHQCFQLVEVALSLTEYTHTH